MQYKLRVVQNGGLQLAHIFLPGPPTQLRSFLMVFAYLQLLGQFCNANLLLDHLTIQNLKD